MAIFKATGYGYKDFNIIINKDLSVDVRQSQNVEVGFTQDKEKQYDLINDQDKIYQELQKTDRTSEDFDSDRKIDLIVENRSWLDIKLEWLDYDGKLVDYSGVVNEEKEEKIIQCKSVRMDPCSYDEHVLTVTTPGKERVRGECHNLINYHQFLLRLYHDSSHAPRLHLLLISFTVSRSYLHCLCFKTLIQNHINLKKVICSCRHNHIRIIVLARTDLQNMETLV